MDRRMVDHSGEREAMTSTITLTETYTLLDCGECGTPFAFPAAFVQRRREDHRTWYCPNGHTRWFPEKTDVELALEKRDRERERAERLQAQLKRREVDLQNERKQHSSTKGELTKARKRAANGVCPCCHRTFKQVDAHMKRQHPEYVGAHG